jgi:hypothetical protein
MRGLYLVGMVYIGLSAVALFIGRPADPIGTLPVPVVMPSIGHASVDGAASWFQRLRPFCNSLEVETAMRNSPAPNNLEGTGYGATCWALAGKIDRARETLLTLPAANRYRAVGIVFAVAHPIADMGNDLAAGPIMELTVEFWPNHYMALYHAGASRFELDQRDEAREYLTRFLENYSQDDGWTGSARSMLKEMAK